MSSSLHGRAHRETRTGTRLDAVQSAEDEGTRSTFLRRVSFCLSSESRAEGGCYSPPGIASFLRPQGLFLAPRVSPPSVLRPGLNEAASPDPDTSCLPIGRGGAVPPRGPQPVSWFPPTARFTDALASPVPSFVHIIPEVIENMFYPPHTLS